MNSAPFESCCGWRRKPIKEYLVTLVTAATVSILFLGILFAGIYSGTSLAYQQAQAKTVIEDSVLNLVESIVSDGIRRTDIYFDQTVSKLKVVAFIRQDQSTFTFAPDPSTLNRMGYVSQLPLSKRQYLPQYDSGRLPVTFERSSYNVPNRLPSDVWNFTASQKELIQRSFMLDTLVAQVSRQSFSTYTCFPATGLNLEFPGVGQTTNTSYDCMQDPSGWPTRAFDSPAELQIEGPYDDANVNVRMLSLAYAAYDSRTTSTVASSITGTDLPLDALRVILSQVNFRNLSVSALVNVDTLETALSSSDDDNNLVFDKAVTVTGLSVYTADDTDSYDISQAVSSLDNAFVLVARVPQQFMRDEMAPIVQKLDTVRQTVLLCTILVPLGVCLLVVGVIYVKAKQIAESLPKVANAMSEILRTQVGAGLSKNGPVPIPPTNLDVPIQEEGFLVKILNMVKDNYSRSRTVNTTPVNPFYKTIPQALLVQPVSFVLVQQQQQQQTMLPPPPKYTPLEVESKDTLPSFIPGPSPMASNSTASSVNAPPQYDEKTVVINPQSLVLLVDQSSPRHTDNKKPSMTTQTNPERLPTLHRMTGCVTIFGTFLAFLFTLVLSIVLVSRTSNDTYDMTVASLTGIANDAAKTRTATLGDEVDSEFRHASAMLRQMVNITSSDRLYAPPYLKVYWARTNTEDMSVPPMDMGVDNQPRPLYGAHFRYNVTTYNELLQTPYVNETAGLIHVFRPIKKANPRFSQLYVGCQNNLIFSHEDTWTRSDKYQTGFFYNTVTKQFEQGWKPYLDKWFQDAIHSSSSVNPVWGEPYYDPDTGVQTLTVSMAVPALPGCVMAIDLDLVRVRQGIADTRLTENGYTIIVHRTTRFVISHPKMDLTRNDSTLIDALEPGVANWTQLLTRPLPFVGYSYRSSSTLETYNMSCAWVPTTNYVACTVYPCSDVRSPAQPMRDQAHEQTTLAAILLTLSTVVLVFWVLPSLTRCITDPIVASLKQSQEALSTPFGSSQKTLACSLELWNVETTASIVQGCVQINGMSLDQNKDVLLRQLVHIRDVFARGLEQYTKVNDVEAVDGCLRGLSICDYQTAALMFSTTNPNTNEFEIVRNIIGQSINHIRVLWRLNHIPEGTLIFDTLVPASAKEHDVLALAERLDLLLVWCSEKNDLNGARACHDSAVRLYKRQEWSVGVAKVAANMARCYLKLDQDAQAEALLMQTIEYLKQKPESREYFPYVMVQQAMMYSKRGDMATAAQYVNTILNEFKHLDTNVLQNCTDFRDSMNPNRRFRMLFMLDMSGSMGWFYEATQTTPLQLLQIAMSNLVQNELKDNTEIEIRTFASQVTQVPLVAMRDRGKPQTANYANLLAHINDLRADGGTDLYNAVTLACQRMTDLVHPSNVQERENARRKLAFDNKEEHSVQQPSVDEKVTNVVVVLTDGVDGNLVKYPAEAEKNLRVAEQSSLPKNSVFILAQVGKPQPDEKAGSDAAMLRLVASKNQPANQVKAYLVDTQKGGANAISDAFTKIVSLLQAKITLSKA